MFLVFTVSKRSMRRLCFYTCLSVILFTGGVSRPMPGAGVCRGGRCPGPGLRGSRPRPGGCPGPGLGGCPGPGPGAQAQAWGVCIPAYTEADTNPPPRRWLLLQTVRILLECILVSENVCILLPAIKY